MYAIAFNLAPVKACKLLHHSFFILFTFDLVLVDDSGNTSVRKQIKTNNKTKTLLE